MCRFVGWLQKAAPPSVPGSGHKTAEEAADSLPIPCRTSQTPKSALTDFYKNICVVSLILRKVQLFSKNMLDKARFSAYNSTR